MCPVARPRRALRIVKAPETALPLPFEAGCEGYARVLCQKEAECLAAPLRLRFGTVAQCTERMELYCLSRTEGQKTAWTEPRCVHAVRVTSCATFVSDAPLAECTPTWTGRHTFLCASDDDCDSGLCLAPRGILGGLSYEDCLGSCARGLRAGEPCALGPSLDSRSSVLGFMGPEGGCSAGLATPRRTCAAPTWMTE